jgi:beta-glucanase (GH16 family)
LVDPQTPLQAVPASVSINGNERWKLVFSDEFNDTVIEPTKWTVETTTRKRPDILVKSDPMQVEEKDGNSYIYYRKSRTEENTYFAGRFNSRGHFATTYGYLEARMHIIKPDGYQVAFWMMPDQEGLTAPKGVTDGTANDGAEIDIIEGNKAEERYSTGLHWDGYITPLALSGRRKHSSSTTTVNLSAPLTSRPSSHECRITSSFPGVVLGLVIGSTAMSRRTNSSKKAVQQKPI